PLDHAKLQAVDQRIRAAAQQAAAPGGLSAILIERFLRTGEEAWEGAGSGRFSLAQLKEDEAYSRGDKDRPSEFVGPSRRSAPRGGSGESAGVAGHDPAANRAHGEWIGAG